MHLVGYLYEDYHDARSLEHKVKNSRHFIQNRSFVTLLARAHHWFLSWVWHQSHKFTSSALSRQSFCIVGSVRFEVLPVVTMSIAVIRTVTPYSLLFRYHHFREPILRRLIPVVSSVPVRIRPTSNQLNTTYIHDKSKNSAMFRLKQKAIIRLHSKESKKLILQLKSINLRSQTSKR